MKRLGVVGVVVALAMTLSVGSAIAGPGSGDWHPPGLTGNTYLCDGQESVVFGGAGRSGWLNGSLYQPTMFHFEVYFAGELVDEYHKTFGKGPQSDSTVECTATFEEDGLIGYFTVTAVKVPGH